MKINLMDCLPALAAGFEKLAMPSPANAVSTLKSVGGKTLSAIHKAENPLEVAGLAGLAAPSIDNMVARRRARAAGLADESGYVHNKDVDKFRLIKEKHHDAVEAGGLGVLAAPVVSGLLKGRH